MSAIDPFLPRTRIAYFSMEMALRPEMKTYSGGLGVLAGDTARSCADLDLPVVFVTLASSEGYLRQEIDVDGASSSIPTHGSPPTGRRRWAPWSRCRSTTVRYGSDHGSTS